MRLKTSLAPRLKSTAQTVLVTNLLHLSGAQVEEAIAEELVDNPALERAALELDSDAFPEPETFVRSGAPAPHSRSVTGDEDPRGNDLSELIPARVSALDQVITQARLTVPVDRLET